MAGQCLGARDRTGADAVVQQSERVRAQKRRVDQFRGVVLLDADGGVKGVYSHDGYWI
jgi:hypothetical protein